jgi:hypothetical protein
MRRLRLLVLTLGLAVATPAFAQDDAFPTKANGTTVDDAPPPAHEEGAYGGVKPGEPKKDGRPIKKPRAGTLAWVGFEDGGGRARIFLMSPTDFAYSQRVEGGTLVVHLDGVKRLARNVKRPLDTRFFDTPVARITVKKVSARRARKGQSARKAGVEVRIAFKNKADAREAAARTATEADGWFYLYLDLEGGGAAPADEPAANP